MTGSVAPLLFALLAAGPSLSGVVKGEKASGLPAEARAALATDGSVVVAGRERQFFALYDRNAYAGIPSFVSADVVLHLVHLRVDGRIAKLERERALPALTAFARSQATAAAALLPASGPLPPRFERLAALHATAAALLDDAAPPDPRVKALVDAELARIHAGAGLSRSPLCDGAVDYSRFRPRGHYAGWLSGYFRAVTLYLSCGAKLEDPAGLAAALDLAGLAVADPAALARLQEVRSLVALIAGASVPDSLDRATGPGATQLRALLRLEPGATAPGKPLPAPQAETSVAAFARALAGTGATFRLLAEGDIPDSRLFAATTAWPARPFPSALDLLAALGSPEAKALLAPEVARFPPLGAAIAAPFPGPTGGGLYGEWLSVLGLLVKPPGEGHPPFERTARWGRRLVVSAAGSWAELRHDTLLYVKQPLVMAEGGHQAELPAVKAGGYVEPRPELYEALLALLGRLDALDPAQARDQQLPELLEFLQRVSKLELAGEPVPREVDERLRAIGPELEKLTRGHADRLPDQALTADVAGVASETGVVTPLQVGIGDVDELWVVVPRGKGRLVTRGGVFSYYEQPGEANHRLDDHEFRSWLDDGRARRPSWAAPLAAGARSRH